MTNRFLKNKKTGGFILLFSLLISSIMLTAGLAVARIITRQIYMASVQRDSQMALFAADAGLECGRYWKEGGQGTKMCNGKILDFIKDGSSTSDINTGIVTSWFNLGTNNDGTCVQLVFNNDKTKIVAKGFNVACNSGGQPEGGRVVERELVYIYN